MKRILLLALMCLLIVSVFFLGSCQKKEEVAEEPAAPEVPAEPYAVGVFVPGVVAGSPLYEQLVSGAEGAVSEFENASIKL